MRHERIARLAGLALVAALLLPTPTRAQMMGGMVLVPQDDQKPAPKPKPPAVSPAAAKTWIKLDQPVTLPFENATPLSEVVKYIKNATSSGPGDPGIPIYVDPNGLQEQDKTMESTVTITLEGVPLATTLRLMLDQLNLTFFIQKDGLVIIDAADADPPRDRVAPLSEKAARTWLKLAQAVDVPFENETPLSEVLKFVRSSTAEGKGPGVPIYVDPAGLQKADKAAESPVSLKIEGVPLSRSLRIMLAQLDLDYYVNEDGVLVVTNKDAEVFQDFAAEAVDVDGALREAKEEIEALRKELDELKKARKEKVDEVAKPKLESLRKELDELDKVNRPARPRVESLRDRLEELKLDPLKLEPLNKAREEEAHRGTRAN